MYILYILVYVHCICVYNNCDITYRFRSKLTDTYGEAHKPIVYCGRGRPPKRALLNAASGGMVRCHIYYEIILIHYVLVLQLALA